MGSSLTENTLFRLATKKFVKSVGGPTLLPVPNVQAGHVLLPLSIVVKHSSNKWFRRKKCEYSIRETKLTEVLEDKSDLDVEITEIKDHVANLRNSNCTCVSGKTGFSLFETLFARGKIVKYTCHSFTSGRTEAKYITKRDLLEALKNRKIDVKDPEISQIIKANRNAVLCVVVSVIRTTERVDITEQIKKEIEGCLQVDVPDAIGGISFGGGMQASPQLSIDPTVLAYEVCELKVDMTDGTIEVLLEPDLYGGFYNFPHELDKCEAIAEYPTENFMRTLYEKLTKMPVEDRTTIKEMVMMSADDVDIICQILFLADTLDKNESRKEKIETDSFDTTSISTGYHSEPTTPSDDDVTTPIDSLFLADTLDKNESRKEKIETDSFDTTSISTGYHSEPTTPSDDDVTTPIDSGAENHFRPIVSRTMTFRRMLEVIGWRRMGDTMVQPTDKEQICFFHCFFVLLKRLHQEMPDIVKSINTLTSRTRNQLLETCRLKWVPNEEDETDMKKVQVCIETEELSQFEQLCGYLQECDQMTCAIFSMLLAHS
ncbi:uncharacterized protein LOC132544605 [Ylistrum balloti]|uniref:uncharacterized protein LOC132544605 n=1 Tax=Ylistrum balloti TaxID=509963 RepID=UPI002905C3A8|nr:uncharacterized protein LOC132544605 [Ylistrum balloti]